MNNRTGNGKNSRKDWGTVANLGVPFMERTDIVSNVHNMKQQRSWLVTTFTRKIVISVNIFNECVKLVDVTRRPTSLVAGPRVT